MSNVFGENIKISIFGESHGEAVGIIMDGVPAGLTLDMDFIKSEMKRRAPGQSPLATSRREKDEPHIISGILEGVTTGAPLCALIYNENVNSGDYNPDLLRPGHADFTAFHKFKGYANMRGSGYFSGRLTAPLVFAGALAKQILKEKDIYIEAKIISVYDKTEEAEIADVILETKAEGDSVGGIIECVATGIPKGLGSPFFGSCESVISSMLFSIPAVKGVEFGGGFGLAYLKGSEANDQMQVENGEIMHISNNNGGILGGITNGEPIVVRVAIKPTPSIAKEQKAVNIKEMTNVEISTGGRHDPCIVPRALPVIEAAMALCILDLERGKFEE